MKLVFNFGIATKTGTANSFENEYFVLSGVWRAPLPAAGYSFTSQD